MKKTTPAYGEEPIKASKKPIVELSPGSIGVAELGSNIMLHYCYDLLRSGYSRDDADELLESVLAMLNHISDSDSYNLIKNKGYTLDGLSVITKQTVLDYVPVFIKKHEEYVEYVKRMKEIKEKNNNSDGERIHTIRENLKNTIFEKLTKIEEFLDANKDISESNLTECKRELLQILEDLDSGYAFGLKFKDGERKWSLEKVQEFAKDLIKIVEEKLEKLQMS